MRINVYAEELTDRIEVIEKQAEGLSFMGLRVYLKTHEDMIPPRHQDDDSSAVTFWFHSAAALNDFAAQFSRPVPAEWRPISEAEALGDEQVLVLTENGYMQTMPAISAVTMSNRGHRYFRRLNTLDMPLDVMDQLG